MATKALSRAWWFVAVWAAIALAWAVGLIDKRGCYPGEGCEDA